MRSQYRGRMAIVAFIALIVGLALGAMMNKIDAKRNPIPQFIQTVNCEGEWQDFYVTELQDPWVLCTKLKRL